MKKEVGGLIFSKYYQCEHMEEKIYYTGMPAKNIFSVVYQNTILVRDPISQITDSSNYYKGLIPNIKTSMQLFFPIDQKKIHLKVKEESIEFKILEINPEFIKLEHIIP